MSPPTTHILELSSDELSLINNALNEVCNGIAIDDEEFGTRLGCTRDEARILLKRVHGIIEVDAGASG